MISLQTLTPLLKQRKRLGRGGSRGGTSGHGHKGQRARAGGPKGPGFEGGQMPLTRRLPKRGFNNADFKKCYELVALEDIERLFDAGATVDRDALVNKGLVKGKKGSLIKVLANGKLSKKVEIHAHAFSKTAQEAIKARGGAAHIIQERIVS